MKELDRRIEEAEKFYVQLLEQRRNRAAGGTDVSAAALRLIADLLSLLREARARLDAFDSQISPE